MDLIDKRKTSTRYIKKLKKSFCYDGAKLWNSLPADMRDSGALPTFINAIDAYNF